MNEIALLQQEYFALLQSQPIDPKGLDYGKLEGHSAFLKNLAAVNNSGVSVFDLYKKEHVFASYNFESLFGYDMEKIAQEGNRYFDSRIHPEDFPVLFRRGIEMLRFYAASPPESRNFYKLVNEYRILNGEGEFIRIIEQHQLLEMDASGNPWLSLSVMDISPEQDDRAGVRSSIFNFKTGAVQSLSDPQTPVRPTELQALTKRETQVLSLIRDGHLSKEISDLLSISVHTVNTHRQRILSKLEVGNSIEAVRIAARYGMI